MKQPQPHQTTAADIAVALAIIRASRQRALAARKAKEAMKNDQK